MERNEMKVFYHNDLDGKCSASIIRQLDIISVDENSKFYPMDYGMEFPLAEILATDTVYIVDFSIEPDDMTGLLRITEDVVWIDHHKTAIEKYSEYAWRNAREEWCSWEDIDGIRDTGASGCELTFNYFVPYHEKELNYDAVPEYIKLIGDRDTWTWKYGDRTKFFHAGLLAVETNPCARIWVALSQSQESANALAGRGEIIQEYKERTEQEYIRDNGFWVEFEGHKCYAADGRYSSEPFEVVVPDAEIWLTFRYMPLGYWMVSLYSDKIDVSEIAKQYEYHGKVGGGHKGAAGFECDYPPFIAKETPEPTQRFMQLREFCKVLVMGSDPEGLDVLAETYPEVWLGFVHELEEKDILCDHDDLRFRKALAGLIGGWVKDE